MGGQRRRGIGADAIKARVPQADLDRVAHQEVAGDDDDGVEGDAHRHVDIKGVGQQQGQRRKHQRQHQQAAMAVFEQLHTRSPTFALNRPRGLQTRLKRISKKGTASFYDDDIYPSCMTSALPRMRPPATAPTPPPSPPSTAATKPFRPSMMPAS